MNTACERDFVEALVKETTELLGRSLVSVKGDIKADRNRLAILEKKVNSLRSANKELRKKIQALEENNVKQQDSKIEQLTKRVKALDDQTSNSTVTNQLIIAFTAAVAALNIHQSSGISYMDYDLSAVSVSIPASAFPVATPISTGIGRGIPVSSAHPNFYSSQTKKRKINVKTSSSTYYTISCILT
ncbi:hypothetical protein DPMN_041401 [Dreissena polymorpha]|uniref:Uncharacterized protein n=1 Tax=Dreissena polymorpha TaxID=45954 RepID=A0A9D4CWR4_DREPO|nr:hypothetical protein DPMN_041401 [Dreissena polymorpha]